jgi:hypothetical protein
MKKMKKFIMVAFLAISALGITSCNSDVDPIEYTPQYVLAINVSDLMRNGLFEIFAYEENISAKIAKGEELSSAVEIITNDLGDTIGWKAGFNSNETKYLKDSITVMFGGGSILADNSTKTIDCSKITLSGDYVNTLKFFGTIVITNNSTSGTETSREVSTSQFGWGETTNDVHLDANYTFNSKYSSSGSMTECKVSSGSAMGNHIEYGAFTQDIDSELPFGTYNFFTSGSMTFIVPEFGGFTSPVNVFFAPNSITIKYLGESITY